MNYVNYFTEIEDTFIRRRGRHLLLSPTDWALIENWQKMGVPLHVALNGIEQSFDAFQARPRRRSIKSLVYCQEEVEAQFAEWLAGQQGAAPPADEAHRANEAQREKQRLLDHLARTQRLLLQTANICPANALRDTLQRAADALRQLHVECQRNSYNDSEQLEQALLFWEQQINDALRHTLPPHELKATRNAAIKQLKGYRAAMEPEVYQQTLDNLFLKKLYEQHKIPHLSLFYL